MDELLSAYLAECAVIRVVGKKAKQKAEPQADREMAIEAAYFARKFGLTKEEALKTLHANHASGLGFASNLYGRFIAYNQILAPLRVSRQGA